MRIYVASSWRNDIQPDVVKALRAAGHEVYDFKNPREGDKGFHWSEIDKDWKQWTPEKYRECLNHPVACAGFKSDFDAMEWAECFVGVQPFGRSASMEMGYGAASGKLTILLLNSGEPELMVKMFDHICCSLGEVIEIVGSVEDELDDEYPEPGPPACYGQGDYACGSEECDFCQFEDTCG